MRCGCMNTLSEKTCPSAWSASVTWSGLMIYELDCLILEALREHIYFVDYINMCSYWLASGISAKKFNLAEKRINVTVPASF